jgi:hypothetical protein
MPKSLKAAAARGRAEKLEERRTRWREFETVAGIRRRRMNEFGPFRP